MKIMKCFIQLLLSSLVITSLPSAGVLVSGNNIAEYMKFPPAAGYVKHEPFSWIVFFSLTGAIIVILLHPVLHIIRSAAVKQGAVNTSRFPWWGYAGIAAMLISWIIAWTRFPLFDIFQRWTFFPLWISYIVTVNALCIKRGGLSLLAEKTGYFLLLFPASAAFWWLFEYLNRFTENWYYTGTGELSPLRYFLEATLAFSTVLPAVMSTAELVKTFPRLYADTSSYICIKNSYPLITAALMMTVAGLGLFFTAIFPEILFPLLWISPFIIIISIQTLAGEETLLSSLKTGDWRAMAVYPLAALLCGFFWEMWNIESQAKWIYSIPYVHGFKIFEMPLLGYAGYLPFGLECAVVAGIFAKAGEEPWMFRR